MTADRALLERLTMRVEVTLTNGTAETHQGVSNAVMDMDLGGALVIKETVTHTVTPEEAEESRASRVRPGMRPAGPLYKEGQEVAIEGNRVIYAPGQWTKFEVIER